MFKKLWCLAIVCIATIAAVAQKPVTITGVLNFDKMKIKTVKLFKVKDGECVEMANINPTEKGNFGFLFYPEYEGLYAIGTGTPLSPNGNYEFYFKGGDKMSVEISDWDYKLTGTQNSKENILMSKWHQLVDSVQNKAINFNHGISTYVDFFPQLEETVLKAKNWLKGKSTGNPKFDKAMPGIMQMDMYMYATNFLQTPRTAHPATEELSPYYATVKTVNIASTTSMIYTYPWGLRTLNGVIALEVKKEGKKYSPDQNENLKQNLSYVPNDTLKGDIILSGVSHIKTFENYKQTMNVFGQYVITDNQKKKDIDIVGPLATLKKGDDAYNFSYPDVNGKLVSMKDMKGKVVFVDVWATWCGPCKKEIPHLKKLEEEMKGKNVEFVSISVDEAKDKEKWLKMIDTEKLGGTQLFATGWSDIAKYYKITGIPRFMIFDKNGKIVTADSPRPSEEKLKELLEKTLAE